MSELPVLFLSHGAPDLPLSTHPAKEALQNIGKQLRKPHGIIIISAHWVTSGLMVGSPEKHTTIHDFSGFPRELYQQQYPARGSESLAREIHIAFNRHQLPAETDRNRGLDHGAWIPLMLIYPQAEVPVVSISLPAHASPNELENIGAALSELRNENLIICSGAVTHNLQQLMPEGTPPADWAVTYTEWVKQQLLAGNWEELKRFKNGPQADMAHPTDEHFLPVFCAVGAAHGQPARVFHESFSYGNLSMAVFAFGDAPIGLDFQLGLQ